MLKMGRTQLQDAVPMTLGQEFNAFAETLAGEVLALERDRRTSCARSTWGRRRSARASTRRPATRRSAPRTWRGSPGSRSASRADLIEATQDTQAFVLYSSCMKSLAIKLSKVCNDLRLLSSGPRCGLREINLPPKQPGSSIMPGKVNPVIPEVVNMVCFRVIGSDLTVSLAAEGGQLQLNVFEPVIAACIFEAQTMFMNAARTLRVHCVDGITANPEICRHYVDYSIGTVTALNPVIGYDKATELAAEAMKTGRGILDLIREKKILTEEQIAKVLDPEAMTGARTARMRRRRGRGPRRRPARSSSGAAHRGRAGRIPPPAARPGGGRFEGTWPVAGRRSVRSRRKAEPAGRDRRLAGAVVLTAGEGLSRGFLGEAIGYDDGQGAQPSAAASGPTSAATGSSAGLAGRADGDGQAAGRHDHRRHRRYAGIDGRVLARLAVRRPRARTARSRPGPSRLKGGSAAPGTAPVSGACSRRAGPAILARAAVLALALGALVLAGAGGARPAAWHLFALFLAAIVSVVIGALPILTASVLARRRGGPHRHARPGQGLRRLRQRDDPADRRRLPRRAGGREVRPRPAPRPPGGEPLRALHAGPRLQHLPRRRRHRARLPEQHRAGRRALPAGASPWPRRPARSPTAGPAAHRQLPDVLRDGEPDRLVGALVHGHGRQPARGRDRPRLRPRDRVRVLARRLVGADARGDGAAAARPLQGRSRPRSRRRRRPRRRRARRWPRWAR